MTDLRRPPQTSFPALAVAAILYLCGAAGGEAVAAQTPPGTPNAPRAPDDGAAALSLAVVNGDAITLAELRESFGSRHSGHGGLLVGEEIIRTVIGKAVDERLLIQEGRRMGIPDEPGFKQAVSAFKDILLLEALEERHIREAAEPADADMKAAYDLLPRQLHVAIVETRERAMLEEARGRVRIGEDFDSVARQMSSHQSRTRGGDLGWITWGMLDPATETVALRTPPSQISEPFQAGERYRILKVIEEKEAQPPAFEKAQGRIRAILRARNRERLRASLLSSIRTSHPPVEDAAAIRRLTAAPRSGPADPPEPPDNAVLMTTSTGLPVTAGYVRQRARKNGLSPAAGWKQAADDALLIDEARRRIRLDPGMERRVRLFEDGRIREEIERSVILRDLSISDAEVKAFFESDPSAFAGPPSYHVRHIVLGTRDEAEEAARLLASGAEFAALAREKSVDAGSAKSGGDVGWIDGPPAGGAREGIFALKPGETSGAVETPKGFSIVQVLEIRPAAVPSFEQARHEVAQRLTIKKQHDLREAWLTRLKRSAKITVNEAAVGRAVKLQDALAERRLGEAPQPGPRGGG